MVVKHWRITFLEMTQQRDLVIIMLGEVPFIISRIIWPISMTFMSGSVISWVEFLSLIKIE